MNSILKELAKTAEPKLKNLNNKDKKIYQFGLSLLSSFVCEEFIDLPVLSSDRFSEDGLFYTIPYLHDDTLWHSGNSRMLMVVYRVENRSSFCPLRIEVELIDRENFAIHVYDQSGEKTIKKSLVTKEDGDFYSEIKGYEQVKLSELIQHHSNCF